MIDKLFLIETANIFANVHAKTRMLQGGPQITETLDGGLFLVVRLQPYNQSRVDAFQVAVSENQVTLGVFGLIPGEHQEGFQQVCARKTMDALGMDPRELAGAVAALALEMT